jgi:hypothetical protein
LGFSSICCRKPRSLRSAGSTAIGLSCSHTCRTTANCQQDEYDAKAVTSRGSTDMVQQRRLNSNGLVLQPHMRTAAACVTQSTLKVHSLPFSDRIALSSGHLDGALCMRWMFHGTQVVMAWRARVAHHAAAKQPDPTEHPASLTIEYSSLLWMSCTPHHTNRQLRN